MTCEHLRPLLDEGKAMQLLFKLGENLARAHVPEVAVSMVRSGRLTALSKPDGGFEALSAETSFAGWWHERLPSSWEKQLSQPLLPTNTHCRPVQGVSALPMHCRDCAS